MKKQFIEYYRVYLINEIYLLENQLDSIINSDWDFELKTKKTNKILNEIILFNEKLKLWTKYFNLKNDEKKD